MKEKSDALRAAGRKLRCAAAKYRIPLLAALLGVVLLLWPAEGKKDAVRTEAEFSLAETEAKLEALLREVDGAGRVRVMLTLSDGGEAVYQMDETEREEGRETKTVLADKAPVLVQTRKPQFQGAVVVCEGADEARVKLAVFQAVKSLTGLVGSQISVIKMKGQ